MTYLTNRLQISYLIFEKIKRIIQLTFPHEIII